MVKRGKDMIDWKSIITAPRDGTPILACEKGYPHSYVVVWDVHNKVWLPESRTSFAYPDYWMPLPAPPESENA